MPLENIKAVTTLYEEYKKAIIQYSDYINKLKETVASVVKARQLVSLMSDTKWLKLQNAINSLAFSPANLCRCVTEHENIDSIHVFSEIPSYIGDWSNFYEEGLPVLFTIEWIKVRPQLSIFRGLLIEDEVIDETEAFRNILEQLHIPYEEENNIFTIYGYKKL